MQLVNRPEDNIFNGDIGYIYDIFKEAGKIKIVIDYDDNFVTCLLYTSISSHLSKYFS